MSNYLYLPVLPHIQTSCLLLLGLLGRNKHTWLQTLNLLCAKVQAIWLVYLKSINFEYISCITCLYVCSRLCMPRGGLDRKEHVVVDVWICGSPIIQRWVRNFHPPFLSSGSPWSGIHQWCGYAKTRSKPKAGFLAVGIGIQESTFASCPMNEVALLSSYYLQ